MKLIILLFSAISFIFYAVSSLYSERMILEYNRWGYKKFRKIISLLQFLGGFGLLFGLYFPLLLIIVSALLTLMMIIAIYVRIRIKDNIINTLPAILYTILNFIIFYDSLIV
ncbi:MAG: DoxX family protein [Flavobacteriales bacterium]|nr:DoxX family protein [Flavobacteriales bacterium]